MAGEAETAGKASENLYVQLIGDGKSYGNMLKGAVQQTEQASRAIAQETAKITAAVKNDVAEDSAILQHMTESRLAKVGQRAVGSGLIIVGLVKRMLGAFQSFEHGARSAFVESETTLMRLTGVLEANGAAVDETMAKYEEFADTMKATSTMSGTAAKQLLANAGNFGMVGNAAMRAVRDAQALAARKGGDPGQWIRAISMLEQGQVAREFMRLTPEIKKAKTEAEKIKLINKFIAESQRFINAEAATAAGRWRQMKNEIGDVLEILGKTIVNAMKPLVEMATRAARWFQSLNEEYQTLISNTIQIATLVTIATAAWGIFGGPIKDIIYLVGFLVGKFGLLVAAVAGVGYAIYRIADAYGVWDALKAKIQETLDWLTDYFGESWDAIVQSVSRGDLTLAVEIAWLQIKVAWLEGTRAIREAWIGMQLAVGKTVVDWGVSIVKMYWKVVAGAMRALLALQVKLWVVSEEEAKMMQIAYNMLEFGLTSMAEKTGKKIKDNLEKSTAEGMKGVKDEIDKAKAELNAALGKNKTTEEDNLWFAFMGDTAEWRAYLEEEFGIIVDTAADYGERSGGMFSNEFAKALKFDAAEAGTAEAMARIREFMDTGGIGGEGSGGGKGKYGALGAIGAGSAEGQWDLGNGPDLGEIADNTGRMEDILSRIESNTGRDPIVFNEAALA
jgi:hypothetical protein